MVVSPHQFSVYTRFSRDRPRTLCRLVRIHSEMSSTTPRSAGTVMTIGMSIRAGDLTFF